MAGQQMIELTAADKADRKPGKYGAVISGADMEFSHENRWRIADINKECGKGKSPCQCIGIKIPVLRN